MDAADFCIALAKAESEEETIALLNELKLWDASDAWLPYGATENNFPIVGNQQGSPTAALIEKLTNAIDAVLMAECLGRGIDPEGPRTPNNMVEACEKFFGVPRGRIFNLFPEERRRLAENIYLVATGKKEQPCLSIIDLGEGQTPDRMPDTLLSLVRENKLRIPFVQGKFNMGGSGVLPFCGSQNLQLIISRRHPSLRSDGKAGDGDWGFTIVRRNNPRAGRRSSTYVYLAPHGKILRFKADSLPLMPGKHPEAYGMPLSHGTFIKLYEYKFESKSLAKSPIMLDLFYELNRRLHTVPIPIRMAERRSFAKGHSLETMLLGLSVRVEDRKVEILEPGFPVSAELVISGVGKLPLTIFVFKKAEESKDWTTSEEAVFFTINGQSHGTFPAYFYRRRSVGLDYLARSLLVSIDCEGMDGRVREDLFMPSRDRLRDCEQRKAIEEALEEFLHDHPALRELNARRRQEEIRARVADEKPLTEVLQQVIRSTPSLAALFGLGGRISAPHVPESTGRPFEGKFFPTFFQLEKEPKDGLVKECPKNRTVRVFCQTDAVNDYFTRDRDPGSCTVIPPNVEVSMHLWNGRATVTLKVPENIQPGENLPVIIQVTDRTRMDPFDIGLTLRAGPEDLTERVPRPSRPRVGGSKSFDLPNIDEVYRDRWQDEFTDRSALRIKNSGDGGWDFRVNMDNLYLLHALKNAKQEDHEMRTIQTPPLQVLDNKCSRSELRKLGISRNITTTQDRFAVISGIFQCMIGFSEITAIRRHSRVILWIDEMEDLILYPARYHRPFTQGIRFLADRLPTYFTLLMNFTFAGPTDQKDIDVVLGSALLDRVTHTITLAPLDIDAAVQYVTELLKSYRVPEFSKLKLPSTYPFDEEAVRELVQGLSTRTPRSINKQCASAISAAIRKGVLKGKRRGLITGDFVASLREPAPEGEVSV